MRKKIIISCLLIMTFFSLLMINKTFASDDLLVDVLSQMDTLNAGVTQESKMTKLFRTLYAITQITVIGGSIAYFTWHSRSFFSSDPNTRKKAKDALPYRILALVMILAIDGLVAILAKYFLP